MSSRIYGGSLRFRNADAPSTPGCRMTTVPTADAPADAAAPGPAGTVPPRAGTGSRPLRADARRNRARLLEAARQAFDADGTDAALEQVARRAGVGIGTLYRHFPTRDDLVEALVRDGMDHLVDEASDLLGAADAGAALRRWLGDLIPHGARYRGLAASLAAARNGEGRLADACHRQEAALTALVDRARDAGDLRAEVTVEDVLDLVTGLIWAAEQRPDADVQRLLDLVLAGLQPRADDGA